MTFIALPTAPSRADPANFAARSDAMLTALARLAEEVNAASPRVDEVLLAGTSAADAAASAAASAAAAASSSSLATLAAGGSAGAQPGLRPTLLLDFANGQVLDPRITFARASVATRVNAMGLVETVAANLPRFDHDPVTRACSGLLIEGQRTNLVLYSQDLSQAAWNKGNTSVTASAQLDPSGAAGAWQVSPGTETVAGFPAQSLTVSGSSTYVLSLYAKAGSAAFLRVRFGLDLSLSTSVWVNLSAGTFHAAGAQLTPLACTDAGGGWWRVAVAIAYTSADAGSRSVCASPVASAGSYVISGSVHLWGIQHELGTTASSYIPTTSASVTRSADLASLLTLSPWFNASASTLVVDASAAAGDGNARATFSDGTNNHRVMIDTGTTAARVAVTAAGVEHAAFSFTYAYGQRTRFAVMFGPDHVKAAHAGILSDLDFSTAMPSVNRLVLGARGDGATQLFGHLARLVYWPRRLADAELQALTA